MKLKQLLENTTPQFPTSKEEVELVLKKYKIANYTINRDLTVDVDGGVSLFEMALEKLPIKFGKVSGIFDCRYNYLTNLKGAPREVGGDFWCSRNRLTSLLGAPREVGGDFLCSYNNLTSLRGTPREVGGDFYCNNNPQLKSLDGIGNVHGQILSDFE